jgi:ATP-dependent DNA ligase
MLATLTNERFSREGWLFEPKWDGERCLAFRRGGDLRLLSRNSKSLNETYPEIVAAFQRQQSGSFIVDGEIVAFENGVTSFAKLQQRMQVERPSTHLMRRVSVCICLFDLLYLDRYDPLRYRKDVLFHSFDYADALRFTEHRERDGEAYYRAACLKGREGVIAKDGASVYVSRRTTTGSSSSAGASRSS